MSEHRKYAVVTQHPNGRPRSLYVHGWYETEQLADAASVVLVAASSEMRADGARVISPRLNGLAIVGEDQLRRLGDAEWTWTWP